MTLQAILAGQAELELAMLADMARRANPENGAALSSQISRLSVARREFSGVGCFTTFDLASGFDSFPDAALEGVGHLVLNDWGLMSGARFPTSVVATFLIAVAGNRLTMLEGQTLEGEPWPADVSKFEIVS